MSIGKDPPVRPWNKALVQCTAVRVAWHSDRKSNVYDDDKDVIEDPAAASAPLETNAQTRELPSDSTCLASTCSQPAQIQKPIILQKEQNEVLKQMHWLLQLHQLEAQASIREDECQHPEGLG